jgi:hypothetical protein
MAVGRESAVLGLDVVGIREGRGDKGGAVIAEDCSVFSLQRGGEIVSLGHRRLTSPVKTAEPARERMSYIYIHTYIHTYTHTHTYRCPGGNVPHFGRMFFTLKYTDLIQNTYTQS